MSRRHTAVIRAIINPMKEYPAYAATELEVIALVDSQRLARIVTIDPDGIPRIGLHVFIHDGLTIEVHMAVDDAQLADVKRGSPVVIEVDEPLAMTPSHWHDAENATNADQFYRCASVWGSAQVVTDAESIAAHLRGILARYQPEGRHSAVTPADDRYRDAINYLAVVRVEGKSIRSKFKLAQRSDAESRERTLAGLAARRGPLDDKTASLL